MPLPHNYHAQVVILRIHMGIGFKSHEIYEHHFQFSIEQKSFHSDLSSSFQQMRPRQRPRTAKSVSCSWNVVEKEYIPDLLSPAASN